MLDRQVFFIMEASTDQKNFHVIMPQMERIGGITVELPFMMDFKLVCNIVRTIHLPILEMMISPLSMLKKVDYNLFLLYMKHVRYLMYP